MNLPTQRQQQARDRACHTFGYYMGLIMGHAGARVTSDNRSEWDGIIDDLIEACTPATEQLLPNKTLGSHENPRPDARAHAGDGDGYVAELERLAPIDPRD